MSNPQDRASRQLIREQIAADLAAAAALEALTARRSMKCAGLRHIGTVDPLHADQQGGCANTGSTCICECHDQPDARPFVGCLLPVGADLWCGLQIAHEGPCVGVPADKLPADQSSREQLDPVHSDTSRIGERGDTK